MHTHGIPHGSAAQRLWQPVAVQFLPRHRVQIGRAWAEGPTLQRPAMARREVKTGAGLPTGDVATPEVRGHILARNAGHRWRGGRRHTGAPTLANALAKLQNGSRMLPMQEARPATAHMFIVNPLTGGSLLSLFSTHPPMEERIARLQAMR